MKKEQQDLVWACLPKEVRDIIRREYRGKYRITGYSTKEMFGLHNLESDTEPEEMLIVERKEIQWRYARNNNVLANDPNNELSLHIKALLESLFGDKCLPDKDISKMKTTEQPEPKFKVGDKVKASTINTYVIAEVVEVNEIYPQFTYKLKNIPNTWFAEYTLEPYNEKTKEPIVSKDDTMDDTKETMEEKDYPPYLDRPKRIVLTEKNKCKKCGANAAQCADSPCQDYPLKEKELDIYELLQDYSDVKTIYSVVHDAEVEFKLVNRYIEFMGLSFYSNGSMYDVAGRCMLYPSRALYEKYPLDAYSAWMEWKESRKPKYVLQAELRLISNDGKTVEDYENIEVEMSDIDLTKAAEAVRECLMKFHEKKVEK